MPRTPEPRPVPAVTRILITGSRVWTNAEMMERALFDAIAAAPCYVTVVHGAARGADELAAALVATFDSRVSCESWPADWDGPCRRACIPGHRRATKNGKSYCPAAGAYRNQQMIDAGAHLVLAFPLNESPGTRDCIRRAERAGIRVIDVPATVCAPLFSSRNRAAQYAYKLAMRSGGKRPPEPVSCQRCGGFHVSSIAIDLRGGG